MMKRVLITLLTVCALYGCGSFGNSEDRPEPTQSAEKTDMNIANNEQNTNSVAAGNTVDYETYKRTYGFQGKKESYTAGVLCEYTWNYDDETMEVFSMDGVIELSDIGDSPIGHYSQNMNSDGTVFTLEGNYYGGRLYNVYNGVTYYEDHTLEQFRSIMLVPMDAFLVAESYIPELRTMETEEGIVFIITLNKEGAEDYFLNRYDFSGLNTYQDPAVVGGTIEQVYDKDGFLCREKSDFEASLTSSGITVDILYHSEVGYLKINETEVIISDEIRDAEKEYVSFLDIDTNAISDAETTVVDEGSSVTEIFQSRLVNRLKYEIRDDGTYYSAFNDSESYTIDFENKQFSYANHTLRYVYNWGGDFASFQTSCNYDFKTDTASADCQDSVLDMIQTVKQYFQMELYYCGLSLNDLRAEE